MPKSLVSDFERFALKVEKNIAAKIKKNKRDSTGYCHQKEEAASEETEKWLEQKQREWKLELHSREQEERRAITNAVDQEWSLFKKASQSAVKNAVRKQLKEEFPALAECFIAWVSQQYQTGDFIMPEVYSTFVDMKRFDLEVCQEEKIVFEQANLYIEYSVERILEELKDEMTAMIHLKEDLWQV